MFVDWPDSSSQSGSITLTEAFCRKNSFNGITVMRTNNKGRSDNNHPITSDVEPAIIRRFHEAKHLRTCWGLSAFQAHS